MSRDSLRAPIRHRDLLVLDRRISLGADEAEALRFRDVHEKEAFTIVDGSGRYFRASLVTLTKSSAEARVFEEMPAGTESPADITLVCAVLARQRMLTVIQKATELGVVRVIPILSERSVPESGLDHEKAHAWPAQAIRACKQCRRASVPEIRSAIPLASVLEDASVLGADVRVHLDDRTTAPIAPRDRAVAARTRVVFAVGPEGGFTDDERAAFEARGFAPLRLGGRVLRAETAALVGLALLQQRYGDMGSTEP